MILINEIINNIKITILNPNNGFFTIFQGMITRLIKHNINNIIITTNNNNSIFFAWNFFKQPTKFDNLWIFLIFLYLLISCIIVVIKVKEYKEKKYDYKSILIIDIVSLIIFIAKFCLWYSEFLRVYAKTDENLKEYIDSKIRFYQSQNQKVVNVLKDDTSNTNKDNNNNFEKMKGKSLDDDTISNNKMEINSEKQFNNSGRQKDDDISSVDTK